MKKMKKFVALLTAAVMALGMGTSVFAAGGDNAGGTGTITVNNTSETVGKYEVDNTNGTIALVDGKYVSPIPDGYTGDKYKYTEVANSYTAYQIFAASPADDGDDKTSPTNTWGGDDANHVSYTATAAQVVALSGRTAAQINALNVGDTETGAGGIFTFTKLANGDFSVSLGDGKTATDVANYFNANYATLAANSAFTSYPMTVSDGKASATVPYGYYFVTSSNGSVVSVDTTNKNVVINDKNTYLDPFNPGDDDNPTDNDLKNITAVNGQAITPEHDHPTANIGDIVTYTIQNNTSNFVSEGDPAVTKKVSYVYVNDTIGKGLKYVVDSTHPFTVTVGGVELAKSDDAFNAQDPAAKKYYIMEQTEGTGDAYTGDAFTVVIPWLDANGNNVFDDNAVVTVVYSAQLDEYIDEVAGNEAGANSSNSANVKYDKTDLDDEPGPEDPPAPTPGNGGTNTGVDTDVVKVFVYAIAIQKIDGETKEALPGAHFQITDGDGNVIIAKTTSSTETRYMYDSTAEFDGTNVPSGYTNDFVTNADGQIIIYGVKEGTYTATETAAPGGYNMMPGTTDIDASVSETQTTTTTITVTTYFEQDNNGDYKKDGTTFVKIGANEEVAAADRYKVTDTANDENKVVNTYSSPENVAYAAIENNTGSELPSTGGIGTTIFYIVGAILVIGAGVMLVTRRRMAV